MAFTQKQLDYIEKIKKKKEEERKKRAKKWHEAGVRARKRNKKKRDEKKEKEKEKKRLQKEALREKKKLEKKKRGHGRPKKRGPKKKKKYVSKKPKVYKYKRCDFKIVSVLNGKQNEYICQCFDAEAAYARLKELKEKNKEVIFPRKVINAGALKESRDEYLILKKNRDGSVENSELRNEYGRIVPQSTNSKIWVVYDKCERLIEETFWVYGKCPKTNRRTFAECYEEFVDEKLKDNKYEILRVILYKNKIVFKYDSYPIEFVICKNVSDAIRFYNLLENWCKKNKQVFFLGSYSKISDKRRELEAELIELTGWRKTKIQCPSTRA